MRCKGLVQIVNPLKRAERQVRIIKEDHESYNFYHIGYVHSQVVHVPCISNQQGTSLGGVEFRKGEVVLTGPIEKDRYRI